MRSLLLGLLAAGAAGQAPFTSDLFTPPRGDSFQRYCDRELTPRSNAQLDELFAAAAASPASSAVPSGCAVGCILPGHGTAPRSATSLQGWAWQGKCFGPPLADGTMQNIGSMTLRRATANIKGRYFVAPSRLGSGDSLHIEYSPHAGDGWPATRPAVTQSRSGARDISDFKDEARQVEPGLWLGCTFVNNSATRGQLVVALRFAFAHVTVG